MNQAPLPPHQNQTLQNVLVLNCSLWQISNSRRMFRSRSRSVSISSTDGGTVRGRRGAGFVLSVDYQFLINGSLQMLKVPCFRSTVRLPVYLRDVIMAETKSYVSSRRACHPSCHLVFFFSVFSWCPVFLFFVWPIAWPLPFPWLFSSWFLPPEIEWLESDQSTIKVAPTSPIFKWCWCNNKKMWGWWRGFWSGLRGSTDHFLSSRNFWKIPKTGKNEKFQIGTLINKIRNA